LLQVKNPYLVSLLAYDMVVMKLAHIRWVVIYGF